MPTAITVLSAGAVKPGLAKVIESFRRKTGSEIKISFATAPAILKQIGEGALVDIVIAPPAVLDELGNLRAVSHKDRVIVGRIGVGVMVRDSAPMPQIASVSEFKQSIVRAESVVYNQASTGTYLESLFGRLGIAEQLAIKTTRYPDFAAVLDHVSRGNGLELGFGATTVIIENSLKGVKFAGPLPAKIQNYTEYAATLMPNSAAKTAASQLMSYLASPPSKSLFAAAGIE